MTKIEEKNMTVLKTFVKTYKQVKYYNSKSKLKVNINLTKTYKKLKVYVKLLNKRNLLK